MSTTRREARLAGSLYLLLALTAPLGLLYVPSQVFVPGDPTATAERLRASEGLVRLGIGSELGHQALQVFLVLSLYRLFRAVDETLAQLVVILGALVSVPIVFANVLNDLAALAFAGGASSLAAFDPAQRDALAYVFFELHGQGIVVASVFWGLWLFPLGLLVIRSGFAPRVVGALLVLAGAAYVVTAFVTLVVPAWADAVAAVALPFQLGELPIVGWLLFWGFRPARG